MHWPRVEGGVRRDAKGVVESLPRMTGIDRLAHHLGRRPLRTRPATTTMGQPQMFRMTTTACIEAPAPVLQAHLSGLDEDHVRAGVILRSRMAEGAGCSIGAERVCELGGRHPAGRVRHAWTEFERPRWCGRRGDEKSWSEHSFDGINRWWAMLGSPSVAIRLTPECSAGPGRRPLARRLASCARSAPSARAGPAFRIQHEPSSKEPPPLARRGLRDGGRYWIRTSDFHRVKVALSR